MITFLTSGGHKYCPEEIADMADAPAIRVWSYNKLLRMKRVPVGTYIFCDFDRLGFWHLELISLVYRKLDAAGATVLNDPARALQRLPLLKQLHRAGINTFQVWDAASDGLPDRYPVFLRTRHAHRGTLSDLLHTPEEAEKERDAALERGYGIHDLMFCEYRAEPTPEGIFRKLAVFRVGEAFVTTLAVHESTWQAKYGEKGIASPQMYQDEYDMVAQNRFEDTLRPAFERASIHYGRADFAIVNGRPEVYEINTNPFVEPLRDHPAAIRMKADKLFAANLVSALNRIDRPVSRTDFADLDHESLVKQRQHDRRVLHERWVC